MSPRRLRSALALTALAALLGGCLLVDDFGDAWKQSMPDPCVNKLAQEIYFADFRRDPDGKDIDQLSHVLNLNGHTYILLKKAKGDKGGRLYRFTVATSSVAGGVFRRWRLDPTMRATFLKDYPNAPIEVSRDTVTIPKLDEATEKLLVEISDKPEYWQVEDQTLYNALHDPACRFDSSPLDALPDAPAAAAPAASPKKKTQLH